MVAQDHGIIRRMLHPPRPLLLPLALGALLWVGSGCESATATDPIFVPPSTIPDPATVALLTGRWAGISTATSGLEDYVDFTFRPEGEHARVRVDINQSRMAEPYANIVGDAVRIDIADRFDNAGSFIGTLDRENLTISGTFSLFYNGSTDEGTFVVVKVSD